MLKIKSIVTVEVNGREYEFSCVPDSPINDAIDANNQINAFLLGRAEQAKNAQKTQDQKDKEIVPVDLPATDEVKQG